MKMYKATSLLSVSILTCCTVFGQSTGKVKRSDRYFEGYSYPKAIDNYESFEAKDTEVNRRLAESYAKVGNTTQSEIYYAAVVNATDKTPKDVYNYASILSMNGKHEAAEQWMGEYFLLVSSDSRAAQYNSRPGYYKALKEDQGRFNIKNIASNSEQEDFGPSYYKNKLVFTSSREGVKPIKRTWNWNKLPFLDMYQAEIGDDSELTGIEQLSRNKNKKYHEGPVTFNKAGDLMVFTRNNYKNKSEEGVIKLQLFESEYKDGGWSKEEALPYNNSEYSVGHGSLSSDGNTLYFASDMPGGIGGVDLYKATRKEDKTWGVAENLGSSINTEGDEMFPFIHSENQLLFFASNGHVGLGGLDVFVTQVTPTGFGAIENVGVPVNGTKDDFSFILDSAMTSGYFASNRAEGKGDDDIYSFQLLKPFTFGKIIKGTAKDKEGNIIANTEVILYDGEGKELQRVMTNEDGTYSFIVDPAQEFSLNGNKEDYFGGKNTASTKTEDAVIIADLILEKDPGFSLYTLVTDKETGAPLEGVSIEITDNVSGEKITHTTTLSGDHRKPLLDKQKEDQGNYTITLQKEGYESKTLTYNPKFDKEGQYEVNAALEATMNDGNPSGENNGGTTTNLADNTNPATTDNGTGGKTRGLTKDGVEIEIKDLADGSIIEINPIYFDFDKSNIRKDAAIELDKIVKIMNQYTEMEIELGSHTDSRGSDSYNKGLATRRAKASASYIKNRITNPSRIYGKGYGESILVNGCSDDVKCSNEQHEENRRTEFKVIKVGKDNVKIKNNSTDSFGK